MTDREAFGAWLRRERERRGLSLDVVANRTKVAASLLDGLERGDLSRWPAGIFRRAFVRTYAEVVGLDPGEVAREFALAHPEDGEGPIIARRPARMSFSPASMRLQLAEPRPRWWKPSRTRLAAVAVDAACVAAAWLALKWLPVPLPHAASLGVFAVVYFGLGTFVSGASFGVLLVRLVEQWQATRAGATEEVSPDDRAELSAATRAEGRVQRRSRRVPSRASNHAERSGGDTRYTTH